MKANRILNEEMQGQKLTNFLVGYVLGLAALFVAFEYSHRVVKSYDEDIIYNNVIVEDDMIPITFNQPVLSPPPAAAPTVAEFLNVVDNDVLIEDVVIPSDINSTIPGENITDGPVSVDVINLGPIQEPTPIEDFCDVDPQFPGDINKWLSEHLKYPAICQELGIQGRVVVTFVVNEDGSIEQVQTRRNPDPNLSKEAERVVKMMPKWIPGQKDNKPVRSYFNLPVTFRLN